MKFYFIVGNDFGPSFIKTVFAEKVAEGLFPGRLNIAKRLYIGPKLSRIVKLAIGVADRVIILMDAKGESLEKKTEEIKQYLRTIDMNRVRIVLLDHEIEEWICYSQGIRIKRKPSETLYARIGYRKNQLPSYASKLDCEKLKTCPSFKRLIHALSSSSSSTSE